MADQTPLKLFQRGGCCREKDRRISDGGSDAIETRAWRGPEWPHTAASAMADQTPLKRHERVGFSLLWDKS